MPRNVGWKPGEELVQEIHDNGPYYDDAEADFGGDGSMNFDDMLGNGDGVGPGDYFFDALNGQEMHGDVLSTL
jgi:hypothetical protein